MPVGVALSPIDAALYLSSLGEGVLYRARVPLGGCPVCSQAKVAARSS